MICGVTQCMGLLLILSLTLHFLLAFRADHCRSSVARAFKQFFVDSGSHPFPPALVSTGMGSGEYFHWKAGVVPTCTCLPWIPPCYAWGDQAPVQPGTSTQAHLLMVISLTTSEVCAVFHIHVSHKSQTSSTSSLHKDLIREWLRDFKSWKGF